MDINCTVYKTADFIGKRWTIVILLALYKGNGGTMRYNEIKKEIRGITPKILSARLKELEENSMVSKETDASSVPIKCYYSLTKSGEDFIRVVQDMKAWALKWNPENKVCKSTDCKNCKI